MRIQVDIVGMFWWFKRGADYVRYESREAHDGVYELRLLDPEGAERVERFDTEHDLNARQRELERGLIEDGWTGPHGWNL
jgi:hypothetical protein